MPAWEDAKIHKHCPRAFTQAGLDQSLKETGGNDLLPCGLSATAREMNRAKKRLPYARSENKMRGKPFNGVELFSSRTSWTAKKLRQLVVFA